MIARPPETPETMGVTFVLSRIGSLHRVVVAFLAAKTCQYSKARLKNVLDLLSPSLTVQLARTQSCVVARSCASAHIQAASVASHVESARAVPRQVA